MDRSIAVLADRYLFGLEAMVPEGVNLHLFDPARPLPEGPLEYDALLIRTVTKINRETLDRFSDRLRFVGTGSSGTEHVDRPLLVNRGIRFADAAGCNARSVAEYVAAVLLLWSADRQIDLSGLKVGVVGVGHVGRQVVEILGTLGIASVPHDPPREVREEPFRSRPLSELLKCDILTFHVPLVREGDDPTWHWLDERKLRDHRWQLVINTARGGVIDEHALRKAHRNGTVPSFVLDVWENEPVLHPESVQTAFVATPHIAGYSRQAKTRASEMIVEAMCERFALPFRPHRSPSPETAVSLRTRFSSPPEADQLIDAVHPVREYQRRLKRVMSKPVEERPAAFNLLRSTFPLRHEFGAMELLDRDFLSPAVPPGFADLFA